MKRNYLLFAALGLAACAPDASLSLDGNPREVTTLDASFFGGLEGETFVQLVIFSDPEKNAIDDEMTVSVTLEIGDLAAITPGTPVPIGQNLGDPLLGTFDYSCFCLTDATTPAQISGAVTFDILSADRISGEADLILSGADPNGIDLGEVGFTARFEALPQIE
jgi:hypothetical protein